MPLTLVFPFVGGCAASHMASQDAAEDKPPQPWPAIMFDQDVL